MAGSQTEVLAAAPDTGSRQGKVIRILRSVVCIVLTTLGLLCLVLSPVTIWGRNLLLNTDRYVETLKPLASNPGVQAAIVVAVNRQVIAHLNVASIVHESLPPKAQPLAAPLQSAVSSLVTSVTTRFVQSSLFETLWVGINRVAHQQIDVMLTGRSPPGTVVKVESGKVLLDLAPIVAQVKELLVGAGLTVARNVPVVGVTLEIANLKGLESARHLARILDRAANWLPWIGLALTAGGVAVSRRRRRAVITAALVLAAGMLVIGLGLLVGRHIYLAQIPSGALPQSTAASIFDTVVRFLRLGTRLVFLAALAVVFAVWVSGTSSGARSVRRWSSIAPRRLGEKMNAGPVGPIVLHHATALRITVVGLSLAIVVFVGSPGLATIILVAAIALLVLLGVEALRISASRQAQA